MEISYLGQSSFRLKGKNAVVVTDPYAFTKRVAADVVTVSGEATVSKIDGTPYVIHGAGEYEVRGIGVIGFSTGNNTMYRIEIDGVSVVHLGNLARSLTTTEIDELDGVDILLIATGAHAVTMVNEIEPSIVIPIGDTAAFLKEIGKEGIIAQPKLTVSKDKLPEQLEVVVLE